MAAGKEVKPMPFPGESPTVALAMTAGEKFGFHEAKKPARAKPRRKAAAANAKKSSRAKKR